jgi:hypothetical protein
VRCGVATTLTIAHANHRTLHTIIRAGLPKLRLRLEEQGRWLPWYVERELESFMLCGAAVEGFAWLSCEPCDHHLLVPFSCKGRGFCPRCGGRRMAEKSARWVDELFPRVAVRQWVLTVPWQRRWDLARSQLWVRGVLKILIRRIQRHYRRQLKLPRGKTGSVTVVQRFGSALNLNVHFHVLMLDGLYAEREGRMLLHRSPSLSTRHVEELVIDVATEAERWLYKQSVDDPDSDCALAPVQAASIRGRSAVSGQRAKRVQRLGGREFKLPPRCASFHGYNLHGNTVVAAKRRDELERLCRYVLRPPFSKERLEMRPDGHVRYTLKRAWSNGTTQLLFTPEQFVERLVALIPPAHANTVLYHGVLASQAKDRQRLLPRPTARRRPVKLRLTKTPVQRSRWTCWAELLERVFGVDSLACPHCGEQMTLRTVVVGPPATVEVLTGLKLSARGPP